LYLLLDGQLKGYDLSTKEKVIAFADNASGLTAERERKEKVQEERRKKLKFYDDLDKKAKELYPGDETKDYFVEWCREGFMKSEGKDQTPMAVTKKQWEKLPKMKNIFLFYFLFVFGKNSPPGKKQIIFFRERENFLSFLISQSHKEMNEGWVQYEEMPKSGKREAQGSIRRVDLVKKQPKKNEMDALLSLLRDKAELTCERMNKIGRAAIEYLEDQKRADPYDEENCSEEQYKKDYAELFAPHFAEGEDFYHILGVSINVVGVKYVPAIVCEVLEAVKDGDDAKSPFENFAFVEVGPFFEEHLFPACKTEEQKQDLKSLLTEMGKDHEERAAETKEFIANTSCFEEAADTFDDVFPIYQEYMTKEELTLFFEKKIFPYCNEAADKEKVQGWLDKFLEKK
jgi:hypothetical protein